MYSKSLTTKTKLLLVLFAFSFKVQAMDQLKENHFTKVPREVKTAVFFDLICSSETIQEASKNWHVLESVDREFNCVLNDPIVIKDIVKTLHKKFKHRKLFVRYALHTKETQQKLKERMKIIGQYAFLHHNEIVYEQQKDGESTSSLLERTCNILHAKRKDNAAFWKNTQNITDDYKKMTLPSRIRVNVGAYKYIFDGELIARSLFYLVENISGNRTFSIGPRYSNEVPEIFENPKLKEMLDESHKFRGEKTLFKMVCSEIFNDFYPGVYVNSVMHDRIKERIEWYVGE